MILFIWIFNADATSTIWLTVVFGVYSGLTLIDIFKFTKLSKKYKKLAEKEDKDLMIE